MKPTTAAELHSVRPFLKLLVYGDTGSGKTTWAARSPLPFFILTEHQGLEAIVAANPNAQVAMIESWDDLVSLVKLMKTGTTCEIDGQKAYRFGDWKPVQTVVIDSLSTLHEILRAHHTGQSLGHEGDLDTPWTIVQRDTRLFLEVLRRLPVNVIAICLAISRQDGKQQLPDLFGSMKQKVGRYFSAVAFAGKKELDGDIGHGLWWQLGRTHSTKAPPTAGRTFPKSTMIEMSDPTATLGSILLWLYPGKDEVAHTAVDSAAAITGGN